MSRPKSINRGSIYWKNLSIVLLITCIPIALISVILYYIGTDRIGMEVNKAHQNQLSQSIQHMEDYLSNLEHAVVRLAFDRNMDETLKQMDFIMEFQKTNDLMRSFTLMRESNSLIGGVNLYLRDANKLIGDEFGFQTIQSEEDEKLLRALLEKERTIYWNYSLRKPGIPDTLYKAIVVKLPGGQMYDSYGAFIIYLDQVKLNTMVQKLASGEGVAFLINENGDYLTTPHTNGALKELTLEDAVKNQIAQEDLRDNTFKFDWQDQSYTVSYGKISKLGGKWTFVSATPLSQIIAPVTSLSRLILWISLFGLTVGLLLSWFASNKIYDPIYRLKSLFESSRHTRSDIKDEVTYIENQWNQHLVEQQTLSMQIKESIPALRESFLLQFLQGNLYTHTELELIDKMKQLDWDAQNKRFAVMVSQLHGISELGGKFSERDSQLITFAASNIILELCSEKLNMVHVINFQDLSVGVFFVLDRSITNEEIKAILNKLAHDYIVAVNNMLRMKVTIVTSKISDSLVDMPNVLEQTRKALRFRDLHTSNQMLDMNQFMMEPNSPKHFPSELEREIVHAVSIGLEEEAVRLIRQFMLELQGDNSTELMVHQGMMKLLGTLHDTIIKHDVNLYALYEGVHLYEQLMHLSEPDQIVDWFQHKLIHPFIKTLSMTYDGNLRETIDKLLLQIQEEILMDVSLEMYADQLQMSSSKLSKAFRQIHGTNFIDTIIRLRIEKCKELLCKTDMKISEIAEQLQYQPSYLIRMFKKSEGMTPRQYREKHSQG
ncbi:AraC-type DNA-binding protein [Paenibacillus sp. 1_12]|uniref:AraC family transcriptional regulator n=1 Tax=Paenibacillus sp. 1_12 TaxID=1566278 RepID=UPI0008E9F2B3|nr:AraC family transcriptional regulator [Paenibacillus sp. 1_12]SFK98409.1 AraC-type DNA-binding protein [Paenibacillus sp. 1_12]